MHFPIHWCRLGEWCRTRRCRWNRSAPPPGTRRPRHQMRGSLPRTTTRRSSSAQIPVPCRHRRRRQFRRASCQQNEAVHEVRPVPHWQSCKSESPSPQPREAQTPSQAETTMSANGSDSSAWVSPLGSFRGTKITTHCTRLQFVTSSAKNSVAPEGFETRDAATYTAGAQAQKARHRQKETKTIRYGTTSYTVP